MPDSKLKEKKLPARDTRAAIIEAAVAILGRTGPAGLTASALTRAVGISKATLFHHFRTVDEIPLVALEHLALQLQAFSSPERKSSRHAIEALGEAADELVERQREFLNAYFVFFAKALFDETLREKLAVCGEQSRAVVAQIVRTNIEGVKTARDVEDFVNLIAIMLDGLALHLLLAQDKRPIMRAWSRFAKSLPTKKASRQRRTA
jgi:AcrR family transcriptional regulator